MFSWSCGKFLVKSLLDSPGALTNPFKPGAIFLIVIYDEDAPGFFICISEIVHHIQ